MLFRNPSVRRVLLAASAVLLLGAPQALATEGVDVFPDASRIASIGGAITEIVYALGEQGRLVARDSTSVYPREVFSLPDVGYMRALSPEGVLSVNPTGILALQGSGPREAVDVLKKASVPYITVPEKYDHAGILDRIRIVAKALGVDAKAEPLLAEVERKLKAAEALTASVKQRKRILFILSFKDGRILASGSGTAAAGIIALAGGVNAVEGYEGYKQLADEAVVGARPDVVLMMDRGGDDHTISEAELFAHPALAQTLAGQAHKLIRMDGAYLLGFGPRTADAVHDLAVALYGGEISD
jgi:iron complex transport system substrate-binding protein